MFDDVERRVRAVRSHNADYPAFHRIIRRFIQHALRHAERADAVLDCPPQRQRRLYALPTTDLPPGRHPGRPHLPMD